MFKQTVELFTLGLWKKQVRLVLVAVIAEEGIVGREFLLLGELRGLAVGQLMLVEKRQVLQSMQLLLRSEL